jgi:hypothetical protein
VLAAKNKSMDVIAEVERHKQTSVQVPAEAVLPLLTAVL